MNPNILLVSTARNSNLDPLARRVQGAFAVAARSVLGAALCLASVGAFTGFSAAQVPEDHAVVGTISWPGVGGTTGLSYVSLQTGKITPLSGLPTQLTVASGSGSGLGGCFSVLRRPSDGTIFVGDGTNDDSAWFHVHILKMAGSVVMSSCSVRVGQTPAVGRVAGIVGGLALLPDGRVLVAGTTNLQSGPLSSSPLAILDDRPITGPTVTPIRISPALATPFALGVATSPDGKTAYVTNQTDIRLGYIPGRLYSIDITKTAPVAPVLLHTWPKSLLVQITAGRDGVLYTTSIDPTTTANPPPTIEEIRVSNNVATIKTISLSPKTPVLGPALDRARGRFVFVSVNTLANVNNHSVLTSDRAGNLTLLAGPPTGGWGMPFAIDINDAFEPYGRTAAQDRHWFQEFPNPGGLPQVGNTTFSLTLRSKTAPITTFVAIGVKKTNFLLMGVHILADPQIILGLVPTTSYTLPLRIPNNPLLKGSPFFVQGVHVEANGGWAATRGLHLSIQ